MDATLSADTLSKDCGREASPTFDVWASSWMKRRRMFLDSVATTPHERVT
jgi:hypothetical protein